MNGASVRPPLFGAPDQRSEEIGQSLDRILALRASSQWRHNSTRVTAELLRELLHGAVHHAGSFGIAFELPCRVVSC